VNPPVATAQPDAQPDAQPAASDRSPTTPSARAQLVAMARRTLIHVEAGTIPLAPGTMTVPADRYDDRDRWDAEIDVVFRRTPLFYGLSTEVSNPGDRKALLVVDTPVIVVRGDDGALRAFVNMCSHRGARLVDDGCDSGRRLTCPYHAWNYSTTGELVGVTNRNDFGDVDTATLGLTRLPVAERCGFVWIGLTAAPGHDDAADIAFGDAVDRHLGGYQEMLDHFDFGTWHVVARRRIAGPNWKLAYDGYLDFYHLPFLHRNTFGPDMSSRPIYDEWGPHQRMTAPHDQLRALADVADDDIDLATIDGGVWTIFPHVSIAGFPVGTRGMMISQLFPGDTPESSVTIQNFVVTDTPNDELRAEAEERADFFEHVVRDEDYFTGLRIQANLRTGAKREFVFGRNEGGGQRFHRYLDDLLAAAGR
jgi:nitrite reductase/ring-hydroxylating ferredoxin subunit